MNKTEFTGFLWQAFRNLGSRKLERLRGKCAMLGLLDRAAQLTNFKWETPGFGPLTYEAALKTTALAATLSGRTTSTLIFGRKSTVYSLPR